MALKVKNLPKPSVADEIGKLSAASRGTILSNRYGCSIAIKVRLPAASPGVLVKMSSKSPSKKLEVSINQRGVFCWKVMTKKM